LSVVLVLTFARSRIGKKLIESVSLKLPVVGLIIMEVNSARTARTMSSLLSSGVPIVNALEVTESVVPNHLYKEALLDARNSIQKGETISTVLGRYEKIYPPFITEMTAVGEETGKISEMLLNVALFYEEDVDDKTKNLSTIIEPVLMIIIGLGVAIFALSMLAPTYSLVDVI
jgi:type IV pilus assembly protein PilC